MSSGPTQATVRGRTRDQVMAYAVFKGIVAAGLVGLLLFLMRPAPAHGDEHGGDHGGEKHAVSADAHGSDGHDTEEHKDTPKTSPAPAPAALAVTNVGADASFKPGDFTLRGTSPALATIKAMRGEELVGEVQADDKGNWALPLKLEPGRMELNLTSEGAPALPVVMTVAEADDAAGALALTEPRDGVALKAGRLTLRGTAQAGELVQIRQGDRILGEAKADAEGKWSFPMDFTGGQSELTFVSLGSNETVQVRLGAADTKAVVPLTLTNPTSGASLTSGTLTLRGTAPAGSTVRLTRNGQALGEAKADEAGKWEVAVPHRASPSVFVAEAGRERVTVSTRR